MARVDAQSLMNWCRALKHGLDVGLSPVKVFRQQSKTGPTRLRTISADVAANVEEGESITDALNTHAQSFSKLFLELISIGEKAGRLPIILGELENHYEMVVSSQRQFRNKLLLPTLMYIAAILILTLLIFILGMIGGSKPIDPIGLGLTGTTGAITFFFGACMFTAIVIGTGVVASRNEEFQQKVESVGLSLPMIGGCFRAFALYRMSLTMHMMIEAGIKADDTIRSSLKATVNRRYVQISPTVSREVHRGEEIASALGPYGQVLFPDQFIQSIALGEETGRLSEIMQKEAVLYRDEAARKMSLLIMLLNGLIYLMVVGMIIAVLVQIYRNVIGPVYNDAMNAADDPQKWLRGG